MHAAPSAAVHPPRIGQVDRGASPAGFARGAWSATIRLALVAAASAVGGCAHHAPGEFDVTRGVTAERLPAPGHVAADLSGAWELDPRSGGQAAGSGRGRGERGPAGFPEAGGMPGGEGGFGGMRPGDGGPGRERGGREEAPGRRDGSDSARAAPRRMVLAQTDSSLAISRPGGPTTTLFFDGRTVYAPDPRGEGAVETNGRWHGDRFEVRRTLESGTVEVDSYQLSKDGATLLVRSRSGSFELRRVYRRTAEAPPPGQGA